MHVEALREYPMWDFLFNNEFYHYTLPKRHVLSSHLLALICSHVTEAEDVNFILV
jgi:hypothetical protein